MMRKYLFHKIMGFTLILAGFLACTAEQDVEPIVGTDNYPVATFTPSSASTSLAEGDTLIYSISTDIPIDRSITFNGVVKGGTATDGSDYIIEPAVLAPYTKSVDMYIIANEDDVPEANETVQFEIGAYSIADRYLLNPTTVKPVVNLTLANVNDPTLLTVLFEWPDHDTDIDIVVWSDTEDYPQTEWSDAGATTANPETDKSIWLSDPVGTYYINIMDWGAETFTYKFTLGHPDGSTQIIEGTFDTSDYTQYTEDVWTAWGGGYSSYRVLQVVNDGTSFVVTKL